MHEIAQPQQQTPSSKGVRKEVFFGFDKGFNSERFSDNLLILCRLLKPSATHCYVPTTKKQKFGHDNHCRKENINILNIPPSLDHHRPTSVEDEEELEETEAMEGENSNSESILSPIDETKRGNRKRKRHENVNANALTDVGEDCGNESMLVMKEAQDCHHDVEIMEELRVNSLLLSSRSEYFHALFTNGMKESRQKGVRHVRSTLFFNYHLTADSNILGL